MGNAAKILFAYALGQITQLVIHSACLANNMYNYRQIRFCLAAGFIILFAAISGAWVGRSKVDKPAHEKKSYMDYAKPPARDDDIDEVVKPFSANKK